ncbi:YjdF family protein [Bacillaceae bacterium Marseille-Q3522]|nr:YjdF family protein [Bacillaceae bacterium Marseille-Q3522]
MNNFDGQYWIGVIEHTQEGTLKVCRHIFGKEPKDEEIVYFVNHKMMDLLDRVTTNVEVNRKKKHINPKRMARIVSKETKQRGISTKAQEALKIEQENRKRIRKEISREQKEERMEQKRQIKIEKHKQKHHGR